MIKKEVIEELRRIALEHCSDCKWHLLSKFVRLAEYSNLKHHTFLSAITLIEPLERFKALEEIDIIRYYLFNEYKFLKKQGFENLADLEMIKYRAWSEVLSIVDKMN